MYIKFKSLEKNKFDRFSIFQVLHSKRPGYLNAWKAQLVKTSKQSSCLYLKKSPFVRLFPLTEWDRFGKTLSFTSVTLGQLVNTIISYDNYFDHKMDNLPLATQMQLSKS